MSYTNLPAKNSLQLQKFEAHVSNEEIEAFKMLLKLSPLGPKTYENTTDDTYFGMKYDWMENAKKVWETEYDWRKTEARINSYPNYTVDITADDGEKYRLHFVALFSDRRNAIPISFLHGWPGSFLEFLDMLDHVKQQYPSPADLPYHIVVPSILGYGYSGSGSLGKNMRMEDQADVIDKLMCGLGFGSGYVSQGGDIGSFLTRMLVSKWPSCKAAHLNMNFMGEPENVPADKVDPIEKKALERGHDFVTRGNAYAREHGTRPATIGFVLSSSPLALLAWIAEKFQTWSDAEPSLQDILDSVTLYWFTQSFPRSIFPYRQLRKDVHSDPKWHIDAPKVFGYSFFPMDLGPVPRAWVETTGNLVWYRQHTSGGHFASMEEPKTLWKDVEDFIAQEWGNVSKL